MKSSSHRNRKTAQAKCSRLQIPSPHRRLLKCAGNPSPFEGTLRWGSLLRWTPGTLGQDWPALKAVRLSRPRCQVFITKLGPRTGLRLPFESEWTPVNNSSPANQSVHTIFVRAEVVKSFFVFSSRVGSCVCVASYWILAVQKLLMESAACPYAIATVGCQFRFIISSSLAHLHWRTFLTWTERCACVDIWDEAASRGLNGGRAIGGAPRWRLNPW